ncbi:hypothetical protein DFJ63DRAFT_334570 [Scheffersomyces coipomensis]|uniref:uncharacterized protein n=1 Tax=Scheffersomyces coipomensis TaxID=1788519 RepID=UPI00315C76AD
MLNLTSSLIPTRSTSSITSRPVTAQPIAITNPTKTTSTAAVAKKVHFLPPKSPPPYILSSSPTVNQFNAGFKCRTIRNSNNSHPITVNDDGIIQRREVEEKSVQLHLPSYNSHHIMVDEHDLRTNKLDQLTIVKNDNIISKFNFENNDHKLIKYKCGDYVRGNIELSCPGEMIRKYKQVKISLEGRYILTVNKYRAYEKVKVPVKVNKFLEMFDIGNEIEEEEETDDEDKLIQGFQFKIPHQLIDKDNRSFQLPPTMGDEKFDEDGLDDIFNDTIINYRIVVRVLNQDEDESNEIEPIIIHESSQNINIWGSTKHLTNVYNFRDYEELVCGLKGKIENGWTLLKEDKSYTDITHRLLPPDYYHETENDDNDGIEFKCSMDFQTMNEDCFAYNGPQRLLPLHISIDNYYLLAKRKKKTSIKVKNFKVELVVVNIKSDEGDIPVELNHNNVIIDEDNLETMKKQYNKPCQLLKSELYELLLKLNMSETSSNRVIDVDKYLHQLHIESEDYQDLRTLSKLKTKVKSIPLKCMNPDVWDDKNSAWIDDNGNDQIKKMVTVRMDLSKAVNQFQLLPSFQSNNLVRFYYLKVSISINNTVKVLKIPVIV